MLLYKNIPSTCYMEGAHTFFFVGSNRVKENQFSLISCMNNTFTNFGHFEWANEFCLKFLFSDIRHRNEIQVLKWNSEWKTWYSESEKHSKIYALLLKTIKVKISWTNAPCLTFIHKKLIKNILPIQKCRGLDFKIRKIFRIAFRFKIFYESEFSFEYDMKFRG